MNYHLVDLCSRGQTGRRSEAISSYSIVLPTSFLSTSQLTTRLPSRTPLPTPICRSDAIHLHRIIVLLNFRTLPAAHAPQPSNHASLLRHLGRSSDLLLFALLASRTLHGIGLDPRDFGLQICQHHCPVWNVASRFPELCAAEQEVVSEIVGTHVQRLATIAGGNCACTTNIPTGTVTVSDLAATIPAPADASASAPTAERTVR